MAGPSLASSAGSAGNANEATEAARVASVAAAEAAHLAKTLLDEKDLKKEELPKEVDELFKKAANAHEKEVRKLVKAHKALDKSNADVAVFERDTTRHERYPAGVRPFKCP